MNVIFKRNGLIDLHFDNGLHRNNLDARQAGKLLRDWGLTQKEFDLGCAEMEANGHNLINYGIRRTFIFTMKTGEEQ